jgi:hypothetical protein
MLKKPLKPRFKTVTQTPDPTNLNTTVIHLDVPCGLQQHRRGFSQSMLR